MNEYFETVLERRGRKALLVDTNLFLLFIVGSHSRRTIPTFKRTSHYAEQDFRALVKIVDLFLPHARFLTTPHVLTEVSNLAGQASGPLRAGLFHAFARLIPGVQEESRPGAVIAAHDGFVRFGITDCGILELESPESIVLTDDLALARQLELKKRPVLNFNHVRIERMRRR